MQLRGRVHGNHSAFLEELYRRGDELRLEHPNMPIHGTSRHLLSLDDDDVALMSAGATDFF